MILFGTILYSYWKDSNIPQDYLSENYISFVFSTDKELRENDVSLSNVIEDIKSIQPSFILHKETEYGYSWIINSTQDIPVQMIEGRYFSDEDYQMKRDVAIVSDKAINNIYEERGRKLINIDNNEFNVIGIYKYKENKVFQNSEVYLNMSSHYFSNKSDNLLGKYNLDCGKNTEITFESIKNKYGLQKVVNEIELNGIERMNLILDIQSFSKSIYVYIILIVIVVHVFSSLLFTKDSKKESYVRLLCGATINDVLFKLWKDYLRVVILSNGVIDIIGYTLGIPVEILLLCTLINIVLSSLFIMLLSLKNIYRNIIDMR